MPEFTMNKGALDKIYDELHESCRSKSPKSNLLEQACIAIANIKSDTNSDQENFLALKNLYTAWNKDKNYSLVMNDINEVLSHFLDLSALQESQTLQTTSIPTPMQISSDDVVSSPFKELYGGLPDAVPIPEFKGIFDFKPTEAEWNGAEDFLKNKSDGSKFEKKKTKEKYSFLKSGGVVYAISNKSCFDFDLRGGNFGIIKKGLRRDGKEVAIKIEDRTLRDPNSHAYRAGQLLGLIISQSLREDPDMSIQLIGKPRTKTPHKLYTILEWAGDDLSSVIKKEQEGTLKISETQRRLIALRTCLAVQAANDLGIIHGDLKPENIMVTINGNNIRIRLVDIDLSKILTEGKKELKEPIGGTLSYVAPELFNEQIYSFASDSYALGIMFLLNMNLGYQAGKIPASVKNNYLIYVQNQFDKVMWNRIPVELDPIQYLKTNGIEVDNIKDIKIIERMLTQNRWERASLSEIILSYCEELLKQSDIADDLYSEIQKIHDEFKIKASKERIEKNLNKPQKTSTPMQSRVAFSLPEEIKDLYSGIPITQEVNVKELFDNLAEEYSKMRLVHSMVGSWMQEKVKRETKQSDVFSTKLPTQLQDIKEALKIIDHESITISEQALLMYLKLLSIRDEIESMKENKDVDPVFIKLISEKAEKLNTLFNGELEKSSSKLTTVQKESKLEELNNSLSKSNQKRPESKM
ncbi:MAG: protein kinase [Gammaproteobacteria bacterium]|jgi:serine/threonine protein kinase|nr:protein kinase [Gammaproteobacteria bacterium]